MAKRNESGFTLLEITAILVLLGLLATFVVPYYLRTVEKGRANLARSQIKILRGVLTEYKLENGAYPTTEQGLAALYQKPTVPPIPEHWDGPYLEDPIVNDPWGRPYQYRCPGEHNPEGYDLWSFGADGVEGGTGVNADITNWK
ncbi:MAG: type II secretion system major pseudopilin GspG [Bacillota bacterium]